MSGALELLDVRVQATVEAPRPQVWETLLRLGEWWPTRLRPDSRVALEPWVGGRLLEDWGDEGGGALLGHVTELAPGSRLAVDGPMGTPDLVVSRWVAELTGSGPHTVAAIHHTGVGAEGTRSRAAAEAAGNAVLDALGVAVAAAGRGSLRHRAGL